MYKIPNLFSTNHFLISIFCKLSIHLMCLIKSAHNGEDEVKIAFGVVVVHVHTTDLVIIVTTD